MFPFLLYTCPVQPERKEDVREEKRREGGDTKGKDLGNERRNIKGVEEKTGNKEGAKGKRREIG